MFQIGDIVTNGHHTFEILGRHDHQGVVYYWVLVVRARREYHFDEGPLTFKESSLSYA